jgi:hypothetical protein
VLDLTAETPLTLTTVTHVIPPGRNGRRTHISTILRWIMKGAKAPDGTLVKLEAARLGGRWMTTREALRRFSERLTPRVGDEEPALPRSQADRARSSQRAGAELERMGL